MPATVTCAIYHCTCLGHLGPCETNRNDPICVATPKVAKASTMIYIVCHCRWHFCLINIANLNMALEYYTIIPSRLTVAGGS
jgi:hypothetical protein